MQKDHKLTQNILQLDTLQRYLSYISNHPDVFLVNAGAKRDHKLTQNILQLFSCNCLDTLLSFLNRFSDAVLPVWSQRQSLSVSNASILVSLATFALRLVKELLGSLLESEDFQFRDARVAQVLLRVHMVLCSAPYFTVAIDAAHQVSKQLKLVARA